MGTRMRSSLGVSKSGDDVVVRCMLLEDWERELILMDKSEKPRSNDMVGMSVMYWCSV